MTISKNIVVFLTSGPPAHEVVGYPRVQPLTGVLVLGVAVLRRLPELSVVPAHYLYTGVPPVD